ncbi:MAG TPA: glycoside hydrolase family 19 protein [Bacteroidales bacterium]|jgi:putative chitinase
MLLKIGSVGEEVRKLQTKLGLNADGSFGPVTESKVKEWQANNNLAANGVIEDMSWGKMFPDEPQPAVAIPPSDFKLENLKGHIPDAVIAQIPDTAAKFGITNVLRLAHFLAQCSHESGGFKLVFENLNYSADGLKEKFKKYFPDNAYEAYARNSAKIGARVYGNRNGNGDEASGEGFKFRGRGFIQLTGKDNYTSFAKFVGEDTVANPDLVASKYPLSSAAFYFTLNNIWTICDRGETDAVITVVTKRVNGGINGLPERINHFNDYYNLLK